MKLCMTSLLLIALAALALDAQQPDKPPAGDHIILGFRTIEEDNKSIVRIINTVKLENCPTKEMTMFRIGHHQFARAPS